MNQGFPSQPRPTILFYNAFFEAAPDPVYLDAEDRRLFIWDRALFAEADAVVFHIPDLVFGTPSLEDVANLRKPPGQVWAAWSMESAVNYPILKDPTFMSRFDLVMSHERDADIRLFYHVDRAAWRAALGRPLPLKTAIAPAVMFQSAPFNKSGRNEYAAELMAKIQVDSYGRFLNNQAVSDVDEGRPTKLATIARYKFCLSFENALATDYVTEKFFDPLLVGTVPVYRGAPNVEQFTPGGHAFIDANDFAGPGELAAYLKELDRDDEAYRRYFLWRERPLLLSFEADLDDWRGDPFAKLVEIMKRRHCIFG